MASLLDDVEVQDAGDRIILLGNEEETMQRVMDELEREGAPAVQKPVRIGNRWVGSFYNPLSAKCTVEKFGRRVVVSALGKHLVITRAVQLANKGAAVTLGPVEESGVWKVYLEE